MFRTEFEVGDGQLRHNYVDLVFEGLDTYANVKLVRYLRNELEEQRE